MVKRCLILLIILCFLFQACSAPVSVGYNKNVVVHEGEDNWFNSEIEIPDNSLVEFTVVGALEYDKKQKGSPEESQGKYVFVAEHKKDSLSSQHQILKVKVKGKEKLLDKSYVVDSSNTIFCAKGGTLMFEAVSPDEFKHIVNVYVKEIDGLGLKKKLRKKDRMQEARARLAQDLKKTKVRGRRLEVTNRKADDETKLEKEIVKELKAEIKSGTDKELEKELVMEKKAEIIREQEKLPEVKETDDSGAQTASLPRENYVEIRDIEEIPSPAVIPPAEEKIQIEVVELSEEEERYLSEILGVGDPIEPFNRFMFKIDEFLFVWVLNPIGEAYAFVVPEYFRAGFKRMDYNIQMPKRLFNNLLQAKFAGAGVSLGRFLVNTTIGIVGFYDPAYEWFGWEKYDEDLGQTLGKWGVGPGFYVYIPVIGATTLRDGLGGIVDDQMDPRAWIPFGGSGIRLVMKFNNLTLEMDNIEQQLESYYDPYSLKKQFWYMKRTSEIDD